MTNRASRAARGWLALAIGVLIAGGLTLAAPNARAEVFVQQSNGSSTGVNFNASEDDFSQTQTAGPGGTELGAQFLSGGFGPSQSTLGANVARSFVFGNDNQVHQFQWGKDNRSDVGIFHGEQNFVAVLQSGHGLRSTVGLINTRGVPVFVLQPHGSPAVNFWAVGLPGGALMIAR